MVGFAVDGNVGVAAEIDLETGGGNDDIGVNGLARFKFDLVVSDVVDFVCNDVGVAFAEGFKEVAT